MSSIDSHLAHDPMALAAAARSILSCPAGASIVVDGVDDVSGELGLQDLGGVPTFSCQPGSPLSLAATDRRAALVTLDSGVGRAGTLERDLTLTLAGTLESTGREDCPCCDDVRDVVVLRVQRVLVSASTGERARVSPEEFSSPAHQLNAGYLQRSMEHANICHQDELRRAVATLTGRRVAEVIGVALGDLTPSRVEVRWVGVDGAHTELLHFPQPARTSEELGHLLRSQLHAGLC